MYSLFGFLCILLPCEMGRGKVSEHHTYVGFDHPHETGSSVHRLFDVNLTIRKGHREIAKFFVILLTFFSYTLASTVTLNLCLCLVYLKPMLSPVHINQCCFQMMTKDSQFFCLTAYSTPIAFRDILRSTLPDFMANNLLRWKRGSLVER